jgi:hypothetical protein
LIRQSWCQALRLTAGRADTGSVYKLPMGRRFITERAHGALSSVGYQVARVDRYVALQDIC